MLAVIRNGSCGHILDQIEVSEPQGAIDRAQEIQGLGACSRCGAELKLQIFFDREEFDDHIGDKPWE